MSRAKHRQTNVEMVTDLMEFSRSGPFMQAFILTAIEKYSAMCITAGADTFTNGLMNGAAWIRCAEEAAAAVDTHLGVQS
jgi:hypothetical protein